ncbi:hypothetical protein [Xanthomonas campestris]|uniref:hypothetical protein n=1 Tax=Xanthomonas campestris TaxID=339 RepID=UPI003CCEC567
MSSIAEEPAQYRHLDEQQRVLLSRFDALAPRQRTGLLDLLLAEGKPRRRHWSTRRVLFCSAGQSPEPVRSGGGA